MRCHDLHSLRAWDDPLAASVRTLDSAVAAAPLQVVVLSASVGLD